MIRVTNSVSISEQEIEIKFIRSQGAGGQHVNKVASAAHLRFDVRASSLPEPIKEKLLHLRDHRLSNDGILVIKAQQFRSQEKNREDAIQRLQTIVAQAARQQKKRKATQPGKAARKKRMEGKKRRGQLKANRRKVDY